MQKVRRFSAALLLAPWFTSVALAHAGHGLHTHPEEVRAAVMMVFGLLATLGAVAWIRILRAESPARKSRRRD
jgi:hypothetical protein